MLQRLLRSLLILFAACIAHHAISQDSLTQWSAPIEIPKSEEILKLTIIENGVPAILTKFGESLILRTFDGQTEDRPLFIRSETESALISHDINDDQMTLLERIGYPTDGTYRLKRLRLSPQTATEVYSHPIKLSRRSKAGFQNPIMLTVSDDAQKVAVCQQQAFSKATKTEFNVFIADSTEGRMFHLPSDYDSDDIELLGATIDTSGIVYLGVIAGVKLNSPFRKRYMIYSFDPSDSVMTEFDMSSQDLFISDVVIHTSPTGLQVGALYNTDPLEEKRSTGYIYLKLTPNGREIEKRIVSTFDAELTQAMEGVEAIAGSPVGNIYVYDILDLGGSPILTVQKYYQDQICTADPRTGMLTCTDQFHFRSIGAVELLKQSTLMVIGRKQLDYDKRSDYTSHASSPLPGGGQVFIYNDHFKNEGIVSDKTMSNVNRSSIRYVRMLTNGKYTTGWLSRQRQSGFVFSPSYGLPFYQGTLYLLSMDNKNLRVGRVNTDKL